jgi:lysozyme family protein
MKDKIRSYEDLEVYQRLCKLHLEVCHTTLTFSAPANLAEGWNNKHINIYLEGINRAQGEIQETRHHISMAFKKKYVSEEKYNYFIKEYDECGKMLSGLENSLEKYCP